MTRARGGTAGLLAIAAWLACACGDRTALLAGGGGAGELPDGATAVVTVDASVGPGPDIEAGGDLRDAATGREAGRDASRTDASCGGRLDTIACGFGRACCSFGFVEHCHDHAYSGSAACPASTSSAGIATFSGGCFVDGAQVGSFSFEADCLWCSTNIDGLVAEAEAACGVPQ